MDVRRGDIYTLDYGNPIGSEQGGRRPALIIQNDSGNLNSSTTIVAAITSNLNRQYPFQVRILASESGLPKDSVVMLEQLLTVSKSRLINKAGHLTATKMIEVDNAIRISLGLSP